MNHILHLRVLATLNSSLLFISEMKPFLLCFFGCCCCCCPLMGNKRKTFYIHIVRRSYSSGLFLLVFFWVGGWFYCVIRVYPMSCKFMNRSYRYNNIMIINWILFGFILPVSYISCSIDFIKHEFK